ncbi:hypothetical protein [Pseudarthrobacter sp. NamE5]|uniref:hypothetical protein n=1 Tax=Pseudarthrobacter sp. NamE5 TaxID=2576839 RepID=UPI00110A7606|nr:hypothetical protein [Pseudarthrobacter sp. NamE5]TLM85860.1 hypothetical protein FDW84_08650 [Pseudarthrobacter sp. NamE5]
MSSQTPAPDPYAPGSTTAGGDFPAQPSGARVGTIVWGLIVLALAALIIIAQLGIVTLNGTYVLIGLMIGAGAALVVGGLLSARKRDNGTTTGKS